ncbi:MAG: hypothetical protein R2681_03395 [Pyrinomonadaceae bacterium]
METLITVAVNDFRLVFRDASLRLFFIFPVLNLFVVRYGFPFAIENFPRLEPYVHILLMAATMQGAMIFGFIYSMVLIDEKDKRVAKVYGILPVSHFWFAAFRLIPPFMFALLSAYLMILVQPFYTIPHFSNLFYSSLCGLTVPMMALFVSVRSKNKIEAVTWQKLFNIPIMLPLLAFFVPAAYSIVFAVFPAYWAYQGFDGVIDQKNAALFLLTGFVYSLIVIAVLIRRFSRSHFS